MSEDSSQLESEVDRLIDELEKPWHDERVMRELYENRGLTYQEIADAVGCSQSGVYGWLLRHGLHEKVKDVDIPDIPDEEPYKDATLMEELYIEKNLGTNVMSALLECANATVLKYLREHDIRVRTQSEGVRNGYGSTDPVVFYTHPDKGTECWAHSYESNPSFVYVHRLVAIAEYGVERVVENNVHHINEIRWDNRPENLTLMSRGEHTSHHSTKVKGLDRVRLAELYEHGDISSRDLASVFDHDISSATVLNVHNEFYGGAGS